MQLQIRDLVRISLFTAAAVTAAVLFRFGSPTVPFSLLPLVAVLAGAVLGPRRGALSMLVYLLLGLIGLPVFATPPYGGLSYVVRPSFGFIPGFALGAYVTGQVLAYTDRRTIREQQREKATRRAPGRPRRIYLLAAVAGVVAIYLVGLPYLWLVLNVYLGKTVSWLGVLKIAFFPYVLPDLVKAGVAGLLAYSLAARLPEALRRPETQKAARQDLNP